MRLHLYQLLTCYFIIIKNLKSIMSFVEYRLKHLKHDMKTVMYTLIND